MMLSQYTIQSPEHKAAELSEFITLCSRLQSFIIRMAGSYTAAVLLLQEHGIQSRLSLEELNLAADAEIDGPIDLISDLTHLSAFLEDAREAMKG